ncbi:MAG: LbtU family siderophore porin [Thermodesulfovibrionales bacterium]
MRRVMLIFALVSQLSVSAAYAGEGDAILNILLKKGIITEQEYKTIKEELKAGGEAQKAEVNRETAEAIEQAPPKEEAGWTKRLKVSGLLEGEYRWRKRSDVSNRNSGSASDLYLRRFELGLEAQPKDWMKVSSVLNSEWVGDSVNQGDEKITVDQAIITFQKKEFPVYLVLGKRTQPFGVFTNHLVTDPMTQDAYEAKRVGVSLGMTGPLGLDVSATVYKGEVQMDRLLGSGLFEAARTGAPADDVASYIFSSSVSPLEDHLTFFLSYLSEPGRGKRNSTVNIGLSAAVPGLEGLRLDAEYMKALARERYAGLSEAFKEGILSVTASYVFNHHHGERHEDLGDVTLQERVTHLFEEPMELALRYERFDDDDLAEKTASWSAKNRYSLGVRYPIYKDAERGLTAFVAAEYRYTDYRLHSSLTDVRADNNKELYLKLGVGF